MILDKFRLTGKKGIVTGAARGIGKGIAKAFVQAGAGVVIADIRARLSEETAEELSKCYNAEVYAHPTDVSDTSALDNLVDYAMEAFGGLDFLVNNAGIVKVSPATEHSDEDWDAVLSVNLSSCFKLSKRVARHMVMQKRGKILNISSVQSIFGGKAIVSYAVSKGGVSQLTRALANDLASFGICVNAIAPGFITTESNEMNANIMEDKERTKEVLSRVPVGRWGSSEDLEGLAVFLTSEASDFITGQIIFADGGYTSM